MTKRGVLLRLLMDKLGIDPQLQTFRARLVIQKSVYLLQALGLQTGFSYGWYLRGPYSPGLTAAAFKEAVEAAAQGDETYRGYSLTPDTGAKIDALNRLCTPRSEATPPKELWLELLASMRFYRSEMYFPESERDRRTDPLWLYAKLPETKKATFTEHQAVLTKEALADERLW